ncbi:MAG: DUF4371 domain-containing protein, partial [Pseudomonadota bacterium]
ETHSEQQKSNRRALLLIAEAVRYCGISGTALRGHEHTGGNFNLLLNLLRKQSSDLDLFLNREDRRFKFTSWQIQNELLKLMAHAVQRKLIEDIKSCGFYSMMIDETTDVSGKEQVVFCIRYIKNDLSPSEVFIAFNDTDSVTGESLSNLALTFLKQMGLPLDMMRGQCYDGAANMSGQFKGVKTRILEKNKKALFVHCVNHNLNLVLQEASKNIHFVRDTLQVVHDIGKLVRESAGRIAKFKALVDSKDTDHHYSLPSPMCATRWITRSKNLSAMINPKQYELVMEALDEISNDATTREVGAKARSYVLQLERGSTYLGILLSEEIFSITELLATRLQSTQMTVFGAITAANNVINTLQTVSTKKWKMHVSDSRPKPTLVSLIDLSIDRCSTLCIFII